MISKKISVLTIGFNYHEINCIQDEINKEFSHVNFDFAISIRDSWYRLNISDYEFILLDITTADVDSIIALQEINRNGQDINIIVTVNANDISKLSSAINMNPYYFVIKDENYTSKMVDLIKNDVETSKDVPLMDFTLNAKTQPFFQSLINTVHDKIMVIGLDYKIKLVNKRTLSLTKCSAHDIIGKKCYEFCYNFDKPCSEIGLECPLKEVSQSKAHTDFMHTHKNPNKNCINQVHISAFPIKNEINSAIEVLIAVKKEEVKQESSVINKKLLGTLVDSINDGLIFCDATDDIVLLNQAAEKILNKEKKQLLGQTILDIALNDGTSWLRKVLESMKSNIDIATNLRIQLKNKWFILRFTPLYNENNQYIGGFLFINDLSAATLYEAKEREINREIFTLTKYFPTKFIAEG